MRDEPWDQQRKIKYQHHDIAIADISDLDALIIKGQAVHCLVNTKENDNVRAIIDAFMGHLAAKGFRIVTKEFWVRELDENTKEINVLRDYAGKEIRREYPKFDKEKK